jgi:hypothetical protein
MKHDPQYAAQLLAEIAALDAEAAAVASQVLERRAASGGNVAGWLEQLEKARASLLGRAGRTRLAQIARRELGEDAP